MIKIGKNIAAFGMKASTFLIGVFAVIVCILMLCAILLMWRLSTGPINLNFAREYVEQALYDPENNYSVTFDDAVLVWPDIKRPFLLRLHNIAVRQGETAILNIEEALLGISSRQLIFGRLAPVSLRLTKPALHLVRSEDNKVTLGFMTAAQADGAAAESAPDDETRSRADALQELLEIMAQPISFRDHRSPFSQLRSFEIDDARMVMEDHILGITWFLRNADLLIARDPMGLIATLDVSLPGGRNQAAMMNLEAVYLRDGSGINARLYIQDFDPRVLSRKIQELEFLNDQVMYITGDVALSLNSALEIQSFEMAVSAPEGLMVFPDMFEAPLPYYDLSLKGGYHRDSGMVVLEQFGVRVHDIGIEMETKPFYVAGDAIRAPVTVRLPAVTADDLRAVWPAALQDTGAARWLTEKMSGGVIENLQTSLDLIAVRLLDEKWDVDAENIEGAFSVRDMTVDYSAPLMPARKTSGKGTLNDDVLRIDIDGAEIEDIAVSGGEVVVTNVIGDGVGHADVRLSMAGPLETVFAYIARDPIAMTADELGLNTSAIRGQAALDVHVSLPTEKDVAKEAVDVAVKGTLTETLLPDVVKTLDLTGGPLALTVGDGQVTLEGKAKLEGRDIALNWQQYLDSKDKPHSAQVKATVAADDDLRRALGIDIEEWVVGTVPVDVVYTEYQDGRSVADVKGNAANATLRLDPFRYEKPPGVPGTFSARAVLQKGNLKTLEGLTVEAPQLSIKNGTLTFNTMQGSDQLQRANFPEFKLEETDAILTVEAGAGGPDKQLKIDMKGAFLDARPFIGKKPGEEALEKEPYSGPSLLVTVDVARLRTRDERVVNQGKIFLNMGAQGLIEQLEVDAQIGQGALYLRLKPDGLGKLALRLEADDAGAMLRAFDIYDNIAGGKIVVQGESKSPAQKHELTGHAQISNFRVTDAPVLAQLVNLLGPSGIMESLGGEGMYFARLESRFEWYMRPTGDVYVMNDGRTSGSSLGLTFAGAIDKTRNYMDLKGHVVPISGVNNMLGSIPIVGSILTGGQGGAIFAATYEIKGPAHEPTVSVNPLSVLAPGIIRRILFENE